MTKIFFPAKTASVAEVWFEGELKADSYKADRLRLKINTLEGALVFENVVTIPVVLVTGWTNPNDDDKRLLSFDEVVKGATQALAATALSNLHDQLRRLQIKADGSSAGGVTADFLGIRGIGDVTTDFFIEINPENLLPGVGADEPVFRASAQAVFKSGFSSPFVTGTIDAAARIDVELTRQGLLNMLPRIDVPELPHFSLGFPKIVLPKWSLSGLSFPDLKLDFFRLPLQDDLGISVTWTPEPKLDFAVAGNKLKLATSESDVSVKMDGTEILKADKVSLSLDGSDVKIAAKNISAKLVNKRLPSIDLSSRLGGPFLVTLSNVTVTIDASGTGPVKLIVTLDIGRVLIQARTDPSLLLAVALTVELTYENGKLTPVLKKLEIVEPYPIKLALVAAHVMEDGARRLLSFLKKMEIPKPDAPGTPELPNMQAFLAVLRRIGQLAAAAATWLAEQGAAGARALAGLAEAVFKVIADTVAALADIIAKAGEAVGKAVIVELRVDLNRWRVVQIVVTPADPGVGVDPFKRSFLGFELDVPYEFTPALVCDLESGWTALVLQVANSAKPLTLSTDLWFAHQASGVIEPVSGTDSGATPNTDKRKPLLQLTVTPQKAFAVALIVLDNGKPAFFRKLTTTTITSPITNQTGQTVVPAGHLLLAARIGHIDTIDEHDFKIEPAIDTDRILSMFRTPGNAEPTDDWTKQFTQHIQVKKADTATLKPPHIEIPLDVTIKISDTSVDTRLLVKVNPDTLSASIEGGRFEIEMTETGGKHAFSLFGLNGDFVRKDSSPDPFKPLFLDFSDGDPRLGLNEQKARIELFFDKLSSGGRGLGFKVDQFIVSRGGIDLDAAVMEEPVTLAGVDMPFRFDKGQMSVKRSQIQSFALAGHGNLPPALVGEAKASIELNFAQRDGGLALQAAKAVLDKTADPLRCEGTQFSISVTKLGLKFVEQGGYHFYFTLTGSAEFRPNDDSFANGLLKNLSALRIVLDEAPLASDPRVLLNHIEFQVTVEPPSRTNFFDLFGFELRGVGFHPAAKEFGGSPAFSISGQVNFTDFGDVVTPRFDFHKMWIAPPESGKVLPRVRFDGLGVGLSLGSMAEASGTAIAVDGSLPTLFKPDSLPANVTAKGFLASGSLRIQGWASMSASMGFLELEKQGVSDKRQAFFLYIQRNDMAEKIPTPIGTIFLREVGYGFGYRYTLAGIAAAEKAETPRELVKVLDEISKYQGSLDDVKAWLPTFDNSALTLALRGLFSLTSVSSPEEYNEDGEKNLPNLVLFDIIAALRTDLTFLMNLRAWIAYNYADWREARKTNAAWRSNPTLTGYLYLSAPRREFLARAVYNPGAEVGDHPKLPNELKTAMKAVRWSSTLYIRPGLFHMEYGWPYELGFFLGDPNGNFYLSVEGGTVLRFEDASILYGLAFRARGHIRFAYDTGGDFGAAVQARAELALGAKLIAYLSANVSDSMFYGVITLDITLEFSVRMWLRTKWFSLSIGFSRSITIHVGVELLVQPNGLAARIEASVAVGAFGRTLSVGIGFTLGSAGQLANARSRVERFLSLGLGSTYPNPEAGVPVSRPAPLPEPPRGNNAEQSDQRIEDGADRRKETERPKTDPLPETDPVDIGGVAFGNTVPYWGLLFPITAAGTGEEYYLIQLVPRDNSARIEGEDINGQSYFYAAPILGEEEDLHPVTYRVTGVHKNEILYRKNFEPAGDSNAGFEIKTDWKAQFGRNGEGNNATARPDLAGAFRAACFMAPGKPDGTTDLEATDIESIPWDDPVDLPTDPEAANIRLAAAARSRADAGPTFKRMQHVEEGRSCFIATVADCAEQLATMISFKAGAAEVDEVQAGKLEFDPRAVGLTFVVSRTRLNELFKNMDNSATEPPKSGDFRVATRIPTKNTPAFGSESNVMLFNPPNRMFRSASPLLKDASQEQSVSGVRLYWDLEPAWTASKSVYGDPEFHLKHYRIERRVENLGPKAAGMVPAPRQFTVKAADHIEVFLKEEKGKRVLKKRRLRSRLQFVDDLGDLNDKIRQALLRPALSSEIPDTDPEIVIDGTRVVYAVVPFDCAGTGGSGDRFLIGIGRPVPEQKSVLKAIARFQYEAVPKLSAGFKPPPDFLGFTVEEEEKKIDPSKDEDKPPVLDDPTDYRLRIRRERTVAVGVFGADALTRARAEPPVPESTDDEPRENEVDVLLSKPGKADDDKDKRKIRITRVPRRLKMRSTPGKLPEPVTGDFDYTISDPDFVKLVDALDVGSSARLHGARLYLRPVPKGDGKSTPPQWCPVQLQLRIGERDPKRDLEPAVDATIEYFEHPLDVQFRPITSKNIVPSSGRLHLYHPMPDATFSDFVAKPDGPVQLLCDGDQRTGVILAWNARPGDIEPAAGATAKAQDLHSLIAGYDLFSLDTTAVPGNSDHWRSPVRLVTPIGRVQRLPAPERGLEPSETGDFARVEAFYPSETKRLTDEHLDRGSGKRRAIWYSPAESFLLWPERPLRRSLLILPDETEIARLFAKQRPAKIKVAWVSPEKGLPEWPVNGGPIPGFGIASEDGSAPRFLRKDTLTPDLTGGHADGTFSVEQVRSSLRRLVAFGDTLDQNDKKANDDPGTFATLAIRLTPQDVDGNDIVVQAPRDESHKGDVPVTNLAAVTIRLSLAPSMHPILADTLDLLQYDASSSHSYRRYEPVLEAAPPLNADRLTAFFDETATDRDPAGWGVLRTLGLAAALRLYDIEQGRFLESGDALALLDAALKRALPRYDGRKKEGDDPEGKGAPNAMGAPFVDVMFTTDGLAELVSHHGTAPHIPDAAAVLREKKALALVQIELRPTVEPLSSTTGDDVTAPRFVHYATLKRKVDEEFVLQAAQPTTPSPVLIEVDALSPTGGAAQRRVLLMQSASDARFPFADGETVSDAVKFEKGRKGDEVAYVRFVGLNESIDPAKLEAVLKTVTVDGAAIDAIDVTHSPAPKEGAGGPWGHFADLPEAWLAAMLFNDGVTEKPKEEPKTPDARVPSNTLLTIARILGPRATKLGKDKFAEISQEPRKRLELVSRLSAWTRRFMERGPAQKVSSTKAGLAFGMLTRPNPWRLAPDKDGRLSIMLAERDRWGKTRKYAVRPFGRYENLVVAQDAHTASEAAKSGKDPGKGSTLRSFEDSFERKEIDDAAKVSGVLYKYFADAVVERTEPLAAPVILATRRNDTADESGLRRPGDVVQIVVSRHPEEVLSDANIRVDAGLAIRHVAVGFWREFATPQWATEVTKQTKIKPIDLLAEFGPFRAGRHDYSLLPKPRPLSIVIPVNEKGKLPDGIAPIDDIDVRSIRELYERHPDLWRGAYVLNLAAMPYGFRLHATAHVAAGVVVSPSSVATVDEAGYQLVLPWQAKIPAHPKAWQDKEVAPPLWAIEAPAPDQVKELFKVVVRWPLVRIVDGMFEEARSIWLQDEDAPDLYRLPDPAVSYRLSIETRDGRARVGEVDIGAITNDPDKDAPQRNALYLNQLIGARFGKPDNAAIPSTLTVRSPTHFELALTLTVKGDAPPPDPKPKPASLAPAPIDPLPQPGDLHVAAADIAVWGEIAPLRDKRRLALTVTPPDVADPPMGGPHPLWTQFKIEVQTFVADIETYSALAGPKAVKDAAVTIAAEVKKFAVDRVTLWKAAGGTESGGKAQPKTLDLPWVLGLPAEGFAPISVSDPKGWEWPTDPPEHTTNAAARATVAKLLDDAIAAAAADPSRINRLQVLKRVVIDAMRMRTVARRRFADEQPIHNLMPQRRLVMGVNASALPDIALTDPVDLLAAVALPAKAGRTETDVEAVIAALEGTENTADTLQTLAALAKQPKQAAEIAVRWSKQATVIAKLNDLSDSKALDPKITTIIVRKPAMISETRKFEPASTELAALADELTEEMLFGQKRRLKIQAFHGLAKPVDSVVERDQLT